MHRRNGGNRQEFQREIAIRHGIDGIAGRLAKTERLCGHMAVDSIAGAGKSGSTDWAFIQMFDSVAYPLAIPAKHFHIGHAVMAEGDWLRGLQMGKAGHDRFGMFLGTVEKGGNQVGQQAFGFLQLFLDPEAEVQRHLVVA